MRVPARVIKIGIIENVGAVCPSRERLPQDFCSKSKISDEIQTLIKQRYRFTASLMP